MLDVVGARDIAARIRVLDRTVVAIRLWRKDNARAFACGLHRPAPRIAGRRNRAHRRTVIRAVARDDLRLAGKHAGNLEGRFIGLGAAGGEEEFLQPRRQNLKQFGAQLRARRRCITGRNVGQLPRLLGNGFDHTRILVAEIDAHQLRAEVEIALARAIRDPATLGVGDVERLPGFLEAPGAVVGCAGEAAGLLCGQFGTGENIAHA